mmetsp:Transcript_233/g.298  ORF Transcript_233/g.298 Transcript_233/m.298 type:complete len:136 (-) Transcript_233:1202-1609(-)|eukprot:CAMPEP_0178918538 /NCGR_PEP_ID=MMETSP0786-20121207/13882_1 /TAXON_ID=186022 /ORGANISM="Thalassionema frauenfeldii, Strain CCMP 1798" /LENGTH=135 /DNA_ID=CAMNT_0020592259 /DNA_START=131 /DNA_END=538 /DNA_ORIENTATION=+
MSSRKENIVPTLLLKAYIAVHQDRKKNKLNDTHVDLLTLINDALAQILLVSHNRNRDSKRRLMGLLSKQKDYDAIVAFRQVAEHEFFDIDKKDCAGQVGEEMQRFLVFFEINEHYPRSQIEISPEKRREIRESSH